MVGEEVPFTSLDVWLKQVNTEAISEDGRAVFSELFPGFAAPRATKPWLRNEPVDDAARAAQLPWEPRRFAGDQHFDRGRYYAVAHGPDGEDDSTLQLELMAYADTHETSLFFMKEIEVDLQRGEDTGTRCPFFETSYSGRVLSTELPYRTNPSGPITHLVRRRKPQPAELWFPLRIVRERIDRVIDLRIPHVGDWFACHFSRVEFDLGRRLRVAYFPYRPPLKRFKQIVPLVLSQEPGGGLFHTVVGDWMRRNGAGALIYPSARNDPEVRVKWGRLEHFKGWNLIDYRNAAPPDDVINVMSGATYWPRQISIALGSARYEQAPPMQCHNVGIRWSRMPWRKGSWRAWGLADRVRNELALGADQLGDPV